MAKPNICPECGHEFYHGWDGIDSHWRSKHNSIMRYEEAWPLIWSGRYERKDSSTVRRAPEQLCAVVIRS